MFPWPRPAAPAVCPLPCSWLPVGRCLHCTWLAQPCINAPTSGCTLWCGMPRRAVPADYCRTHGLDNCRLWYACLCTVQRPAPSLQANCLLLCPALRRALSVEALLLTSTACLTLPPSSVPVFLRCAPCAQGSSRCLGTMPGPRTRPCCRTYLLSGGSHAAQQKAVL